MPKTRLLLGLALLGGIIALLFNYSRLSQNTMSVTGRSLSESGQTATGAAYAIQITYPYLVGGSATSVKAANEYILSRVKDQVENFKATVTDPEQITIVGATSTLTGEYQLSQLSTDRVSFEMEILTDYVGAAHPGHTTVTLNFNLRERRVIELADIIGSSDSALNNLASYVKNDLASQFNNDESLLEWVKEGAAPLPSNYQNFTLSADTLTIIFDPYKVAPYAAGVVRVKVPLTALTQTPGGVQ